LWFTGAKFEGGEVRFRNAGISDGSLSFKGAPSRRLNFRPYGRVYLLTGGLAVC
jgi:hypothetical protein